MIMLAVAPLLLAVKNLSSDNSVYRPLYQGLFFEGTKVKYEFGFISLNDVPQIDHTQGGQLPPQRDLVLGVEVCWSCLRDPTRLLQLYL
jgi:hypothetical protein